MSLGGTEQPRKANFPSVPAVPFPGFLAPLSVTRVTKSGFLPPPKWGAIWIHRAMYIWVYPAG